MNALVINAREAMPHGGTIRISADNIDVDEDAEIPVQPGQYVKVTVADNGIGIDPKSVPKIFDPYFTTKASTSGLGLSISYSVIRKHGGFLHLESISPVESTFAFYLPATDAGPQQPGARIRPPDFHY